MSEAVVVCRTCRTANGRNPKRWEWLCPHCAEECAERHRSEFPDHDLELRVISEDDVPASIRLLRGIERYHTLTERNRR